MAFVFIISAMMRPYNPSTSAKINIRTIPTNTFCSCTYARTQESPTRPMAYPAARPVKPHASPAPRCTKPANNEYLSGVNDPEMRTDTTSPYTAMMPDMTTGIRDFIISSGLNVPRPAMPIPALAVPKAAPTVLNIMAEATPANPKNGAYGGQTDIVD